MVGALKLPGLPLLTVWLSNCPAGLEVTVCGAVSLLTTLTVAPGATVSALYWNDAIVIVGPPAAAAGADEVTAADELELTAAGGLEAVAELLPLPPHAVNVRADSADSTPTAATERGARSVMSSYTRTGGERFDMNRSGSRAVPSDVLSADEDLVRALYDEHAGSLYAYALRLTGDRQHAEDVVQETLLRAWRHPEALASERGPVRPWLFTVALHVVVDRARALAARPREVDDRALATVAAGDDIERVLETWQVADAMSALSADHRAVLVEVYYRGRSVAEAAAALGVPAGTVKSRTYYALRALKLVLDERGVTS